MIAWSLFPHYKDPTGIGHAEYGYPAEGVPACRFDIFRHSGSEREKPHHAIYDTRNGGQQFNSNADFGLSENSARFP